jgi:hypothetical protein
MATARLKARSHEKAQRPTLKARMVLPNDCWSMSDARPSPTTRMGMAQRRLWTPLHPRTKNRMRRWTETAQTRQQTNHTSSHSVAARVCAGQSTASPTKFCLVEESVHALSDQVLPVHLKSHSSGVFSVYCCINTSAQYCHDRRNNTPFRSDQQSKTFNLVWMHTVPFGPPKRVFFAGSQKRFVTLC